MIKEKEINSDVLLPSRKFFTYPEAAEILRCSEKTVFNRVKNGDIVPLRNGRMVLFTMDCLEDYLRRDTPTDLQTPETN